MEDMESRNIVQAYSHLTSVKEQSGQIRANLNEAFSKNSLSFDEAVVLGGNIKTRDINIHKFKLSSSVELKNIFEASYTGEVVERVDGFIKSAFKNAKEATLDTDPSLWFKASTESINILREIEIKIFGYGCG